MTATLALICALLAATMSGAGYNPATAAPRGAPNGDQRSEGRTLADAGEVSAFLGAPLRLSEGPLGLGSRPALDPHGAALDAALEETRPASPAEFDLATGSARLGGAPPLAAVTPSESIAMRTGSFATPAAVTRGTASWFAARGYQGAVPWWRAGQQPVWATVSRFADGKTYSVTVLVTGFCQCLAGQPGERLIDLSPSAFRALGVSLSVGLIEVTMTVPVQGPRLPATDSLEGE